MASEQNAQHHSRAVQHLQPGRSKGTEGLWHPCLWDHLVLAVSVWVCGTLQLCSLTLWGLNTQQLTHTESALLLHSVSWSPAQPHKVRWGDASTRGLICPSLPGNFWSRKVKADVGVAPRGLWVQAEEGNALEQKQITALCEAALLHTSSMHSMISHCSSCNPQPTGRALYWLLHPWVQRAWLKEFFRSLSPILSAPGSWCFTCLLNWALERKIKNAHSQIEAGREGEMSFHLVHKHRFTWEVLNSHMKKALGTEASSEPFIVQSRPRRAVSVWGSPSLPDLWRNMGAAGHSSVTGDCGYDRHLWAEEFLQQPRGGRRMQAHGTYWWE